MKRAAEAQIVDAPISIYEVHLPSGAGPKAAGR